MTCECKREKPIWTLRTLLGALPAVPGDLRRVAPTIVGRPFDNAFRERLMLAVAAENRCRYCQAAHSTFGRSAGLSREEVDAILQGADLPDSPEAERLALTYVRDLARRAFTSRDEELRERLSAHYAPETVEAIEATARLMNMANRFGNSFDAALDRLLGRSP